MISVRSMVLLSAWGVACCAPSPLVGEEVPLEEPVDDLVIVTEEEGSSNLVVTPIEASTGGSLQKQIIPSDDTDPASGGTAATDPEDPVETGMGGEEPLLAHPLFGEGSYAGVDPNDPCTNSQFWRVESALDLSTGTLIIHDGELWELTGEANGNWAMEDCTPPGVGWCADQYAWVVVGVCPEE